MHYKRLKLTGIFYVGSLEPQIHLAIVMQN